MAGLDDINTEILGDCLLFRDVPRDRIPGILDAADAGLERFPAGALVRQQGDTYDALVLLAAGRLEARFESVSGKGLAVEHFNAPSAVATAVLMSTDPILPVSLIAEEEVTLVTIAADRMLEIFTREPAVLKAYLSDAGDKVRFLAEKIRLFRFGSLRMKIVSHLLFLSREQNTDCPRWRYGREQMADLLGVARPSLSRELSRMVDDGIIGMPDRQTVSIDVEVLEDLLSAE